MMTNERKRGIVRTSQFRKDVRQALRQGKDMAALQLIIDMLADDIRCTKNTETTP